MHLLRSGKNVLLRRVGVAALMSAVVLGMAGCAKEKAPAPAPSVSVAPSSPYAAELAGAPAWVLDPAVEGALCAVGSAKIGPAGLQFAMNEAAAQARNDLARQIKVNVANMIKGFTQQTGVGDAAVVDKVVADVSKQLAKEDLQGSKVTKKWISPTGTVWVLVVMPDPKTVASHIKETVKTSLQNDQALWQQFQAKKAQDELDVALSKLDAQKQQ
ncbi:MAG: LPP20 family lipoprotein [Campylobacterales bacterium]